MTHGRTVVAVGLTVLFATFAVRSGFADETSIDSSTARTAQVDTVVVPQKPFSMEDAAKAPPDIGPKPVTEAQPAVPTQVPAARPVPTASAKPSAVRTVAKPVAASRPAVKPVVAVSRPATPKLVRYDGARVEPTPIPAVSVARQQTKKPCASIICSTFLMLGVAY